MIGKLKGILDQIDEDKVILDVSGVGYIVHISAKSLSSLPMLGESTSFLIHMQVKEDDISLYGFINSIEKEWFENLITVQGIGTRVALVILSALDPRFLIAAVTERNKEAFKHISGVGPKLAERIFTELNKKATAQYSGTPKENSIEIENSDIKDALIALTNLGYNKNKVETICKQIYQDKPDISINDLIKSALKELSSS
jgi:holliday junction DNA helicase RuvA